jgi:hypothetical protein
MNETKFKQFIIQHLPPLTKAFRIEAGFGGDAGIADLLIANSDGMAVVEAKLAELQGETVKLSDIRPAQYAFKRQLDSVHNKNYALIAGEYQPKVKTWHCFVAIGQLNQTMPLADCIHITDAQKLTEFLANLIKH